MRRNELRALADDLGGDPPGRVAMTLTLPTRPDGLDRGEATRLRNLAGRAADALTRFGLNRLLVEDGASAEVAVDGVVLGDRIANAVRAAFDAGTDILMVPDGLLEAEDGLAGIVRW